MPFTIAIMQPYFIPYAGYFRLFAASDLFVVYDCVQFPRRGWVHRNQLVDVAGKPDWLTLPIAKAPQDIRIQDLRFVPDAATVLRDRLRPFPLIAKDPASVAPILAALHDVSGNPLDYIERLLELVVTYLDFPWRTVRSSTLAIPASVRKQDRILEIAKRLGASEYVNAPGGIDLYDSTAFASAGVQLKFLPDYPGPSASILTRILHEDRHSLARDIRSTLECIGP